MTKWYGQHGIRTTSHTDKMLRIKMAYYNDIVFLKWFNKTSKVAKNVGMLRLDIRYRFYLI